MKLGRPKVNLLSLNCEHRKRFQFRRLNRGQLAKYQLRGCDCSVIVLGGSLQSNYSTLRLFLAVKLAKHIVVVLGTLLGMYRVVVRAVEHLVDFHTASAID